MLNIRVPVIAPNGKPLMPTKASRARRLVRDGKAIKQWSDLGIYYIQLVEPPSGYDTQEIAIGIDPGKRYSGIAAQSTKATLAMFHLVLMGFIPKRGTAIAGIKDKIDYRRMLRRGRRGRRINRKVDFSKRSHRQERFSNRRNSKLPPSIRSNRQLEFRVVSELCRILPISQIVYELVKADVDLTSKRTRAKSGKGFSPVMVGQKWMLKQLEQFAPVSTHFGWQKDGNGTSQVRTYLGLTKKKKDKGSPDPATHATDGIALASTVFVKYKPFFSANSHGHDWQGEVNITPAIFKLISRPPITRRRLHDCVPSKGGNRERYGGSTTPFDIRKGDLVKYKEQLGYCSGYTQNLLSISDFNWKRTGQRAVTKCQLIARSTGLVVSGASNPSQPPLLSIPNLLR